MIIKPQKNINDLVRKKLSKLNNNLKQFNNTMLRN